MSRPRPRSVGRAAVALGAAAAVVFGASACRVQPGAAAFVGDYRISDSQVSEFVSQTAPPSSGASQGLPPRAQVVSTLVSTRMFRTYLQGSDGGVPTDAQLVAARDSAFSTVTGNGAPDPDQLRAAVERLGYQGRFTDAYIEQIELEYFVIQRSQAPNLAGLAKAVEDKNPKVTISPRYGSWDPAQLSLSGGTGAPDYLTLSTPAAAPTTS